jgi:hypothetical protein
MHYLLGSDSSSSIFWHDYPFGIFKLFFSFFALEMWYDHTEIIKLPYIYKALLEALYCNKTDHHAISEILLKVA